MTATYEGCGISVTYPENWKVTDQSEDHWPRTVTIQGPSGAFWCVFLYPGESAPDEVANELIDAMRDEYRDLEISEVRDRCGDGVDDAVAYDIQFTCLDFIVRAQTRCFPWKDNVCLLMYQAEDREFSTLSAVFEAMTYSMLTDRP